MELVIAIMAAAGAGQSASVRLLPPLLLAAAAATTAQLPPSPPTSPPVPPSSRDPDWVGPFAAADLLYSPTGRPDFEALVPIENCTGRECGKDGCDGRSNCSALWWPGLGNGFLGGIAQGPTLRIAGLYSGDYGRYSSYHDDMIPPVPEKGTGFSNKEFSYRASVPAFASSITIRSPSLLANSSRAALNTRDAVYIERSSLSGGGELELRTYFHRTRRNLIVVEVTLDCTSCAASAEVSLRAFSRPELSDLVFQQRGGGYTAAAAVGDGTPRQLIGVLRASENCEPSNAHFYDTNVTLGYVYDICPSSLKADSGGKTRLQLLSVLTLSSESAEGDGSDAKETVHARALSLYKTAKAMAPNSLFEEHRQGWAALWNAGGIELETKDLARKTGYFLDLSLAHDQSQKAIFRSSAVQQTTNSTLYYLLMSTRPDWLHSALVPSTIAATAPKPHGISSSFNFHSFFAPKLSAERSGTQATLARLSGIKIHFRLRH